MVRAVTYPAMPPATISGPGRWPTDMKEGSSAIGISAYRQIRRTRLAVQATVPCVGPGTDVGIGAVDSHSRHLLCGFDGRVPE